MALKHGLGRGLKALIKDTPVESEAPEPAAEGIATAPVAQVSPSPFQPRRTFTAESMAELVQSIKERGVIQPLLVRKKGDDYELIAGERRLRASREAGLTDVPVIVMDVDDRQALEITLVENLQREDLNVIEEAEGYRELADRFAFTQEQIAQRVGKARASIANALRLLDLPDEVKAQLADGQLTAGHAKVLLGIEIPEEQVLLAKQTVLEGLSVRELEKLVAQSRRPPRRARVVRDDIPSDHIAHVADVLRKQLGTSVKLWSCRTYANGKKAKGRMEIEYYSAEDLTRIMELLGVPEEG